MPGVKWKQVREVALERDDHLVALKGAGGNQQTPAHAHAVAVVQQLVHV